MWSKLPTIFGIIKKGLRHWVYIIMVHNQYLVCKMDYIINLNNHFHEIYILYYFFNDFTWMR